MNSKMHGPICYAAIFPMEQIIVIQVQCILDNSLLTINHERTKVRADVYE